ncbi:MAG: hypothetical protein WBD12_00215, partial [Candidatus Omnitrophota bacterium]
TGDITEWDNTANHNTTLFYEEANNQYWAYEWDTPSGQVNVTSYAGVYATGTGVVGTERRVYCEYVHNSDRTNLDTETNNWRILTRTAYSTDGNLITDEYDYTSGNLTTSRHYDTATGDLLATYTYNATTGRLTNITYEDGPSEYYRTGFIKRQVIGTGHDTYGIYEYEDMGYFTPGLAPLGYGRTLLMYKNYDTTPSMPYPNYYKTFGWDTVQVTVDEYNGVYAPLPGTDALSGIDLTERTCTYVYNHGGEEINLDTTTNGWILNKKIEYDTTTALPKLEYVYYTFDGYTSGQLYTKEVMNEVDPDGDETPYEPSDDLDHELYGKHVKYYMIDEQYQQDASGNWYGRTYRVDNYTDGWYYEITFTNPADPTDGTILRKVKIDLYTGAILSFGYEYYPNGRLKRACSENGDITEFLDGTENNNGTDGYPADDYGRIILYSSNSLGVLYGSYSTSPYYGTWDWDDDEGQVTVTMYDGDYSVSVGDPLLSDVYTTERRAVYVYDHNGVVTDLDTSTNGWTILTQTIYSTDGMEVIEDYIYDANGRILESFDYLNDRHFIYDYYVSNPDRMYSKEEREYSTGDLLSTFYYYNDVDNLLGVNLLENPDMFDNVFYRYENDRFYNTGNVDPYDDYGRVDRQISAVEGEFSTIAYEYTYHSPIEDWVDKKLGYLNAGDYTTYITDPFTTNFTELAVTYAYYANVDNRLLWKQMVNPDVYDNLYYRYEDDDFYLDPVTGAEYGRVDRQVSSVLGDYSTVAYTYSYHFTTEAWVDQKVAYQGLGDYATNPDDPTFNTPAVVYSYYSTAANLLSIKDVMVEADPDGDGIYDEPLGDQDSDMYNDNIIYYYRNNADYTNNTADPTDDYGRTEILENRTDD